MFPTSARVRIPSKTSRRDADLPENCGETIAKMYLVHVDGSLPEVVTDVADRAAETGSVSLRMTALNQL